MQKKNMLAYGLVALLCGGVGIYFGVKKDAGANAATAAAPAPGPVATLFSQRYPDAQGVEHALSQWKGKTLIVNFWAPWCAPCVEEMPELAELHTEKVGANLQVIGIGIDSAKNIAEFNNKLKVSYPLYVGGMGGTELSRAFGNNAGGLPYTVLIGPDGQVKKTYLGRLKFKQLRDDLAKL